VVDFGVAKLHGAAGLTAFNTTVGTVPYMSPEQILGGALDGRTDQFALGAITYEMLSGGSCFGGPMSVPDQALRVLRHVPPPLDGVPAAVNAVLARALAKEAGDRYPTVQEFLAAMAEAAGVGELAPLPGVSTAVTAVPLDGRPDFVTPTSQVDRADLLPPLRNTNRSMRAVTPTGKMWMGLAVLLRQHRWLSVVAGAVLGVLLVTTIWLLAH
jgi:serine/threonine protein kinase